MTQTMDSQGMAVGGMDVEVLRGGAGKAALLLHGFQPISPKAPAIALAPVVMADPRSMRQQRWR